MGALYSFGAAEDEPRHFIDGTEVDELALRAHAVGNSLDAFRDLDDRGDGVLRTELLRQIRVFADRANSILS